MLAGAALTLSVLAAACTQTAAPAALAPKPDTKAPVVETPIAPDTAQAILQLSENQTVQQTSAKEPSVRIVRVHFRGSLQPIGCCTPGLIERDEFVAIKNESSSPQNIAGWKLTNITRGYPTFTFPEYYPCIPFVVSSESKYVVNTANYAYNPPDTVIQQFSRTVTAEGQAASQGTALSDINWSSCASSEPLDQMPMGLNPGQQQGQPVPLILHPGQIILIFTDEIHCPYGGLSFNYGHGNLWDNEKPETAVLYNAKGEEVSRRSYSAGR